MSIEHTISVGDRVRFLNSHPGKRWKVVSLHGSIARLQELSDSSRPRHHSALIERLEHA